jgi:hypothetical protein
MPETVLTQRQLNRALLARQGLLERTATPVPDMIEQLVGMQAQVPSNPYVALWSRLRAFRPEALSALIEARAAVRAQTYRGTIHLHTARDLLATQPVTQSVLARTFTAAFTRRMGGVDPAAVAEAGRALLAAAPRTRAELAPELAPQWPAAEPEALAQAVTFGSALVQVPPRGLWRRPGQARWALTGQFLGAEPDADATADALVLRYLAAFGPATVADARTWSGLTGLRAVVERLRPGLRTFRDDRGRELLDVPDGALPDPATPAPPRFLPEYDNLALSHDDRSRVLAGLGPGGPFPRGTWIGSLLVDGFYRATWSLAEERDAATLTIGGFAARGDDPTGTTDAIAAEADALIGFIAPEAARRVVLA